MSKSGFVPLDRVNDYSQICRVNVQLPSSVINTGDISFNYLKAESLCRLAGISRLTINGDYKGQTSGYETEVTGFNHYGEATGTAKKVEAAIESSTSSNLEFDDVPLLGGRSRTAFVTVNMNEISQRVKDSPRFGGVVRSPEPWAYEVNKAILSGIRKEGSRNLLSDIPWKGEKFMNYFFCSVLGFIHITQVDSFLQQYKWTEIGDALIYHALAIAGINIVNKSFSKNFRLSMFPYGYQYDRAAILKARTGKFSKIVRPTKNFDLV